MHRTTIMLPKELKARAQRRAKEQGISLGDLVRESLARGLEASSNRRDDPLFDPPQWQGDTPADLAAEHDRYLYDQGDNI